MIPDFAEDYEPDALMITPEGGVMIAITTRSSLARNARLAEIAQRSVRAARMVVSGLLREHVRPARAGGSSVDRRGDRVRHHEVRALDETGHERAALVMGWATLEAIARLVMDRHGIDQARPLSPIQACRSWFRKATSTTTRSIAVAGRVRNEIVHGRLGTAISRKDVTGLIANLEAMAGALRQAA